MGKMAGNWPAVNFHLCTKFGCLSVVKDLHTCTRQPGTSRVQMMTAPVRTKDTEALVIGMGVGT